MDAATENQVGTPRAPCSAAAEHASQSFAKPSGLKPPSRIPSQLKDDPMSPTSSSSAPLRANGLSELTDAAQNARGAMGPPLHGAIKHKPTNLPEPDFKRKTLADRAGEPYSSKLVAPQTTRPTNSAVKNTVSNGSRGFSNSLSRSASTKVPKHKLVGASSSVGHGSRALSASTTRPKSSYGGHGRSKSQHQRPATSMTLRESDDRSETQGGHPFSISTNPNEGMDMLHVQKNSSRASANRMYSLNLPPKRPPIVVQCSASSPTSLHPQRSTPAAPADADCDEMMDGFETLSLGAPDQSRASRMAYGAYAGKNPDISFKTQIPRQTPSRAMPPPPLPVLVHKSPRRPRTPITPFVNKYTNDRVPVFDDTRVASLEAQFAAWKEQMEKDMDKQSKVQESIELYKTKNADLETSCTEYKRLLEEYKTNLADVKSLNSTMAMELENVRRSHTYEVDDLRRKYQTDMQDLIDRHKRDLDRSRDESKDLADKVERELKAEIEKLLKSHKDELETLEKKLRTELEEEKAKRQRERQDVQSEFDSELRAARLEADTKEREKQLLQGNLTNVEAEFDRERMLKNALRVQLTDATSRNLTLEASNNAMKEKIDFLESDSQAQSSAFNDLHRRMQEAFAAAEAAQEKLRQEETLRRKLHNQVQELKGNIRVMCRVRPAHESETDPAKIGFPDADTDSKEVAVQGPEKTSAMGTNTTQMYSYAFDRVFSPSSQNAEVFEEISQLVQSALDGYNVCIFCYGQTGSGKTFTMSSADGMIPRATAQIYSEATRLEEKGWKYKMEGSFVEVYNETYNDLLGRSEDLDKKKIEVRHDPVKKQTTLENAVSVTLDGPNRVEEILQRADKNRTVAATKANMRSSRSHSVFILKLVGENSVTGERSEGTLNLVDLAGSERLDHSKAEGARLKETQNINKSLSCLGDVINALGTAKEGGHIPYRNSRLTYLLQYSLGGNSKTLMFVMVSPLQAHLQETITSLKFATKVHNTHIGTAKKQTKASG
ncbi:kinesin-domain-containing protein [Bimuria novae-zelandiae CBS 107.79]|uniref:Kinesin-domain-containing protein n=1 Tax=Bimuria novae-zelandiae CBS 107.79 TaxID=1447943 RepID=A0A6A5V595_9PLEO|nr:kinesin-domain-containing protein [Bimuria novae-zelandiae CBS 107.79]